MAKANGFIFCMTDAEASFFRSLLCGAGQWSRTVSECDGLTRALAERPSRTRLISFCSDLIIPAKVTKSLDGHCFNFHSGPPERPGFRPTAFACADRASSFGVTFHRLVAKIDAGTIYATLRFPLPAGAGHEVVDVLTYQHLIELAKTVAPHLADFDAALEPNGEVWAGYPTTRAAYQRLQLAALGEMTVET